MKKLFTIAIAILACMNGYAQNKESMNNSFLQLAAERYSVRKFSNKKVEQEKIAKILEAAKLAPTAVNSQPQMIYVLQSDEAMQKANKISPCIYGAPQAFLVCYDDSRVCKRGENSNYGEIDCSIVLTHMVFEAQEQGLGTCIVGYFKPEDAIKEFNLPKNMHPVLLLPFGYKAPDAAPADRHTQYRDQKEMVEFR